MDDIVGRMLHEVGCSDACKLSKERFVFRWDDRQVVHHVCVRVLLEVDRLLLFILDGSDLANT